METIRINWYCTGQTYHYWRLSFEVGPLKPKNHEWFFDALFNFFLFHPIYNVQRTSGHASIGCAKYCAISLEISCFSLGKRASC